MKAITIPRPGPPEVLEIRDYPVPEVRDDEVMIKVNAAGVNFADILARKGLYTDAPKTPCVVGYEVAGEVTQTGSSVSEFKEGDRVIALTRFGGYATRVVVSHVQVFHTPPRLSDIQAAALPVNYLTAWQLCEMSGLKAGYTLLIHNAGGAMGLASINLATHFGAKVIGTASSPKHEKLKELGVDLCIDYTRQNWLEVLLKYTGGKGVDIIFDPLGGSSWKQSYKALRPSGRLGMFGVSQVVKSGLPGKLKYISLLKVMPWFNPVQLINQNKGVFGVNIGRLWGEQEMVKSWAEQILKGVEEGWITPHIDAAFQFEEAENAHQYIESRRNFGKVVLIP